MKFQQSTVIILMTIITVMPGHAQPLNELLLQQQNVVSGKGAEYITATIKNTSLYLYNSAEVDITLTAGSDANSRAISNAAVTVANLKPGSIWRIKYPVPASVFSAQKEVGYMITRVWGKRNGHTHVSSRSFPGEQPEALLDITLDPDYLANPKDILNAVFNGSVNSVKSAIKAGADINKQDEEGNTPLINAVLMSQVDVVNILLANKADPNIEGFGGNTALDYATLDIPSDTKKRAIIASALQKVGAVKGDGNKAMYSSDHRLFLRVQKFGSDPDNDGIHIIEGTALNLTDKPLSYVEIDANFQYAGEVVDSGLANVQNLGPHESWHFKITTITKDADDYKLTKVVSH